MQKQYSAPRALKELKKKEAQLPSKTALESRVCRWSNQLGFQFHNAHGGNFELRCKSLGSRYFGTLFEVQEFLENVSLVLVHVRDLRNAEGR